MKRLDSSTPWREDEPVARPDLHRQNTNAEKRCSFFYVGARLNYLSVKLGPNGPIVHYPMINE